MEQKTRIEVTLTAAEMERLCLLAEELASTPGDALRQLAAHGRQGWTWLLWLDLRHQLRTLLMQRLRPRGKKVGFILPRRGGATLERQTHGDADAGSVLQVNNTAEKRDGC